MNIRSIPKNFQYFKDTIMLNSSSININVLGFTETRLDHHFSPLYKLSGYCMYTNSRNIHDSSVAVYVADNYVSSVQDELTISDSYIETIGVAATVNVGSICFYAFIDPQVEVLIIF